MPSEILEIYIVPNCSISLAFLRLPVARLSEVAHYSGSPVHVGFPVLYMRFGAKFWMSDLAHAVYDSLYFYYVIRLRESPFVIGMREVAFIKSIQ